VTAPAGPARPNEPADLWVIVPAFEEAARIGGTLEALAGQDDLNFTLVVVDNGSADETPEIVRKFAASAPFDARLIDEPCKGIGSAVDTGFRYAIEHGAGQLARTDADCLPCRGWTAAARKALDGGAGMACGRIVARRDEEGVAGRAAFVLLVAVATAFGRLRPSNSRRHGYLVPYRMHAGNNMAITAGLYAAAGGMPRQPFGTDREFLNRVRRHTAAIEQCRAMTVQNSTRRLRAYGLRGTAMWYLGRGSGGRGTDPR
jgi:glycosyltransferase involved in cell wall biosynthesis